MMAGRCSRCAYAICLVTLCCGCHSHKWIGMPSKSKHARQVLPAYGMGIEMTPEKRIDKALISIFHAAGHKLEFDNTNKVFLEKMREAMRKIMSESYIKGSHDAFDAQKKAGRGTNFVRGDLVRKRSGSQWEGHVVGEYSTSLTPEGYAVESSAHPGSVQFYPAAALEKI